MAFIISMPIIWSQNYDQKPKTSRVNFVLHLIFPNSITADYSLIVKTSIVSHEVSPIIAYRRKSGGVPFFEQEIQGLFRDFQEHISHISGTPISAKKSLESVFFRSSTTWLQFYFFILKAFLCLLLLGTWEPGWIKLAPKFKDFPAPTAIFNAFQRAKIQGLSRNCKKRANPRESRSVVSSPSIKSNHH